MADEKTEKRTESQEEYCKNCGFLGMCNVILEDGAVCLDKARADEDFRVLYFVGGKFIEGWK